MVSPSHLFLCLALSLGVSCYPFSVATQQNERRSEPQSSAHPTVYSPVVLAELCQEPSNYCIYVDQNRPGTLRASAVNATDSQGAFLFERSAYAHDPFRICYAGSCIDLDFARKPGCVSMQYVSRHSDQVGHLLARFANDVHHILGPRADMWRELDACATPEDPALPYAVIGARGRDKNKDRQQISAQLPSSNPNNLTQDHTGEGQNPASQASVAPTQDKPGHDYFDDVTVPLADL